MMEVQDIVQEAVIKTIPKKKKCKKGKWLAEEPLQIAVPVQVRCTILDAWGWCTGTTQRDGMGREEGGGFRMGNTCIPVVDSF